MIKVKDVIRMKVPFPTINSKLAVQAHMYICGKSSVPNYGFVKCQTLKPNMIGDSKFVHYVDEEPDVSRNPFLHTSRIDCDKFFVTESVRYDDNLRTTLRPDICQELFDDVRRELVADGYNEILMNENELTSLNCLIKKI